MADIYRNAVPCVHIPKINNMMAVKATERRNWLTTHEKRGRLNESLVMFENMMMTCSFLDNNVDLQCISFDHAILFFLTK